ncbi:MAG: hypothetical protein Q9163_005279 [Psora crenata]
MKFTSVIAVPTALLFFAIGGSTAPALSNEGAPSLAKRGQCIVYYTRVSGRQISIEPKLNQYQEAVNAGIKEIRVENCFCYVEIANGDRGAVDPGIVKVVNPPDRVTSTICWDKIATAP